MDFKIFTIVLTSSFLAAALTSFVNWYIQRNNYRNDYYKKILDKRIESYDVVIALLVELNANVQQQNGKLTHLFLVHGIEFYDHFVIRLFGTVQVGFWLSRESQKLLTEFNLFLTINITNKIIHDSNTEFQMIAFAIEHRDIIKDFKKRIEKQINIDLKSLHEIDKFIGGTSVYEDYVN